MNKNDKKISNLDEFFDSDPTDQLPTLTEAALAHEAENPAAAEEDGIPTLLQSQALATELSVGKSNGALPGRGAPVDALEQELADHRLLVQTLQEELAAVENENAELRGDTATLNLELARNLSKLNESQESLEALKEHFSRAEEELGRVHAEAAESSEQLRQLLGAHGDEEHRQDAAAAENRALLARVQDLETYIDGRKAEWRGAAESLDNQTTALEHLREAVSLKDEHIAELEERADRQQEELDRRTREVETLTGTIAAGNDAVKNVTMQLYSTQEQLDELTDQQIRADGLERELGLERARAEAAESTAEEMRGQLEAAEARAEQLVADLREQVTSAEERLGALEGTRKEELEQLEQAQADLLAVATQRDRLVIELQQRDLQLENSRDRVTALIEERDQTMEALTTQRQIIQNMKEDLRTKLDAIAVIAQNQNRPGSASIHRADLRLAGTFDADAGSHRQEPTRMFVALDGDQALKLPIHKDTMTIGRSADNDIRIRRQFISRHHARIETDSEGAIIHDLGSKNGVVVNSVRVEQQRLRDGDLVDLGEMKFRFVDLLKSEPDNPPATTP